MRGTYGKSNEAQRASSDGSAILNSPRIPFVHRKNTWTAACGGRRPAAAAAATVRRAAVRLRGGAPRRVDACAHRALGGSCGRRSSRLRLSPRRRRYSSSSLLRVLRGTHSLLVRTIWARRPHKIHATRPSILPGDAPALAAYGRAVPCACLRHAHRRLRRPGDQPEGRGALCAREEQHAQDGLEAARRHHQLLQKAVHPAPLATVAADRPPSPRAAPGPPRGRACRLYPASASCASAVHLPSPSEQA